MGLQVVAPSEALHALVTPVGLLPRMNPHVDLQAKTRTVDLHAFVTPVGLLPGSRWTELVTGHVGRARGVRMQTIRGGALLCANVIAVCCREENKDRELGIVLIHYYFVHTYHRGFRLCTAMNHTPTHSL